MKRMAIYLGLGCALAASACSKDKGGEEAGGTAGAAAPSAGTGGAGAEVDHSNPEAVVEAIFAAAKSGETSALEGLCDPEGEGDGDTESICSITTDHEKWGEFEEYFADGAVKGAARVDGERAEVDFVFGPGGSEDETMKLVARDGKWYLSSF